MALEAKPDFVSGNGRSWALSTDGPQTLNLWHFDDIHGNRWQIDQGCVRQKDIAPDQAARLLDLLGQLQAATLEIWPELADPMPELATAAEPEPA